VQSRPEPSQAPQVGPPTQPTPSRRGSMTAVAGLAVVAIVAMVVAVSQPGVATAEAAVTVTLTGKCVSSAPVYSVQVNNGTAAAASVEYELNFDKSAAGGGEQGDVKSVAAGGTFSLDFQPTSRAHETAFVGYVLDEDYSNYYKSTAVPNPCTVTSTTSSSSATSSSSTTSSSATTSSSTTTSSTTSSTAPSSSETTTSEVSSTVTPTTTTTDAPADNTPSTGNSSSNGSLAATGVAVAALVGIGGVLLANGGGLMALTRRRRRDDEDES
jgi:hypothetical protein